MRRVSDVVSRHTCTHLSLSLPLFVDRGGRADEGESILPTCHVTWNRLLSACVCMVSSTCVCVCVCVCSSRDQRVCMLTLMKMQIIDCLLLSVSLTLFFLLSCLATRNACTFVMSCARMPRSCCDASSSCFASSSLDPSSSVNGVLPSLLLLSCVFMTGLFAVALFVCVCVCVCGHRSSCVCVRMSEVPCICQACLTAFDCLLCFCVHELMMM